MASCAATCSLLVTSPAASLCSLEASSRRTVQKTTFGIPLKLNIRHNVSKGRYLPAPKAVQDDQTTADVTAKTQKVVADIQAKWEKVENKPTVLVVTGGSIVVLWLSSAILGAFESIPFFPKLFQLIGFGYSTWFVYRFLLFTPNRQELFDKIDGTLSEITGEKKSQVSSEAKWTGTKIDVDGVATSVKEELEEVRKV